MELIIGDLYLFDYTPEVVKTKSISDECTIQLKPEVLALLIEDLRKNQNELVNKQVESIVYIENLKNADKIMEKTLKESFRHKPKKVLSDEDKAINLFIRSYDPEKINYNKNNVKAIYGGFTSTVNGKIQYHWYVTTPIKYSKSKLTEEMIPFLKIGEI